MQKAELARSREQVQGLMTKMREETKDFGLAIKYRMSSADENEWALEEVHVAWTQEVGLATFISRNWTLFAEAEVKQFVESYNLATRIGTVNGVEIPLNSQVVSEAFELNSTGETMGKRTGTRTPWAQHLFDDDGISSNGYWVQRCTDKEWRTRLMWMHKHVLFRTSAREMPQVFLKLVELNYAQDLTLNWTQVLLAEMHKEIERLRKKRDRLVTSIGMHVTAILLSLKQLTLQHGRLVATPQPLGIEKPPHKMEKVAHKREKSIRASKVEPGAKEQYASTENPRAEEEEHDKKRSLGLLETSNKKIKEDRSPCSSECTEIPISNPAKRTLEVDLATLVPVEKLQNAAQLAEAVKVFCNEKLNLHAKLTQTTLILARREERIKQLEDELRIAREAKSQAESRLQDLTRASEGHHIGDTTWHLGETGHCQ